MALVIQTPDDFGAVGDGVADDTTAVQNALNSGGDIALTGVYKTSGSVYQTADYQTLFSAGGRLKPVGNFSALISDSHGSQIDIQMQCAGQTGGYALYLYNDCSRMRVKRLHLIDGGYNAVYVEKSNHVMLDWVYAIALRGPNGIKYYGNSTKRSDILKIQQGVVAFAVNGPGGIGMEWDGNAHSLDIDTFHAVGLHTGSYSPLFCGLKVHNSAGDSNIPQIGRIHKFAADFPHYNGIFISRGDDIDIVSPYVCGSRVSSGILTDPAVAAGTVRIMGGKSIGNAGYGIHAGSHTPTWNLRTYANTLGNSLGTLTSSSVI